MSHPRLTAFGVLVVCVLVIAVPRSWSSETTCPELEKQIADLTRRIEALEARLNISQTPPPEEATRSTDARQEALLLYGRVDELISMGEIGKAKEAAEGFRAKYAGTPDIKWVGSLNSEFAVIGKPAPDDWAIEMWFQGESEVNLDGDRTTLLVFWEAWCPHCKREVPRLQKVYDGYREQGLQILGVTRITRNSTEESVRSFLADSKVDYPIAKETGGLAEYFSVKGIPAAALVKGGTIVWRGHPMRLTDEMLRRWL